MTKNKNYTIQGQIIHEQSKQGLPGLRVEAYDKDYITKDDFLGEDQTVEEGRFTIRFTSKQHREWIFDNKPDLYFRVFDGATLIKDTVDNVCWNISDPEIEIVIAVNIPIEDEPPAPDPVDVFPFFGRLVNKATDEPIIGFLIRGFDLDAGDEPLALGLAFSDYRGIFSLSFTIPTKEQTPETRRLKFIISTLQGEREYEYEATVKTKETELIEITYTLPELVEPPSPTLLELSQKVKLTIPAALSEFLQKQNISTLADLRRTGGLSRMKDLPLSKDDPLIFELEAHANLSALSADVVANAQIIKKGYHSTGAISTATRSTFVRDIHPITGDFKAFENQKRAKAQKNLAVSIFTETAANATNGYDNPGVDEGGIDTSDLIDEKCGCKDCDSAVSPLTYLVDLLDYAVTHIADYGVAIDLDYLATTFHQQFAELPASCEQMDAEVRQVRICIEVLRAYLEGLPANSTKKDALDKAEKKYRLSAYTTILDKLGTSFTELRFAHSATDEVRQALAERLGIMLVDSRPDFLDGIMLDPDKDENTESKLETLFGLASTAADDPLAAITDSNIQKSQLYHLRTQWYDQDWPENPFTSRDLPIIEPNVLAFDNFRTPEAGEVAFDLWQERLADVAAIQTDFSEDHDPVDLTQNLIKVFGEPVPDLDTLFEELNEGENLSETIETIESYGLTQDSFRRFMEIKSKNDDAAEQADDKEWDEFYAILTQARKVKTYYQQWITREQDEKLTLDPKIFTPSLEEPELVKGLHDPNHRHLWLRALELRSSLPIIDPDVVNPVYVKNNLVDEDPAYKLWSERHRWITEKRLPYYASTVESATDKLAGFTEIVEATLGITLAEIDVIVTVQETGNDIAPQLAQLTINRDAFIYLVGIQKLLTAHPDSVLEEEWKAVYSILVQVEKRRKFAEWRDEEKAAKITLSPVYFKLPEPAPIEFPPLTPDPLPEWRATYNDQRDWRDTLEARIDQEENVKNALKTAISEAEEIVLPALRDALVLATDAVGASFDEKAKWLTDKLLIDCKVDGCQLTTRISQAITTAQGLLFSLRNRQMNDTYPELELVADAFDEEWKWLGSYATWRSAMFAFLYPENILIPSLRQRQTPAFRKLVKDTRRNRRLNPEQACEAAKEYMDYLQDVSSLQVKATCQTLTRLMESDCNDYAEQGSRNLFFMFALGTHTNTAYWSVYDPENQTGYAQSFWDKIPGMDHTLDIVGAAPCERDDGRRFIFLFGQRKNKQNQELIFTKYDLDNRRWDDEPEVLELPDEATKFTAVVKQNKVEKQPPHLAIRTENGAIYVRKLNWEGTDWAVLENGSDEWEPTISYLLGEKWNELCAMVEVADGAYFSEDDYFIVVKSQRQLFYRLFGPFDDGSWTQVTTQRNLEFRGAYSRKNSTDLVVLAEESEMPYSMHRVYSREAKILEYETMSDIASFNSWLWGNTGISLKEKRVPNQFYIRFSGMTLYDFFDLSSDELNNFDFPDDTTRSIGHKFYRIETINVLYWMLGEMNDNEEWKEWRIANELVKEMTQQGGSGGIFYLINWLVHLRYVQYAVPAFSTAGSVNLAKRARESLHGGPLAIGSHGNKNKFAPTSGNYIGLKQFAYNSLASSEPDSIFITTFTGNSSFYFDIAPMSPNIDGPFSLAIRYSEQQLQTRKTLIESVYRNNDWGPASNLEYIKEAYYFVPIYIALQLQRRSYFTEALDWFRTVYDYSMPEGSRKIYIGLSREESLENNYKRVEDWLEDPLNPHSVASLRRDTYTRFTILSIVRCFLDFADSEYTRDTPESVPKARELYDTGLKILESEGLKLQLGKCSDLAGTLIADIGDQSFEQVKVELLRDLSEINNRQLLAETSSQIRDIWEKDYAVELRLSEIRKKIDDVLAMQQFSPAPTVATVIVQNADYLARMLPTIQTSPVYSRALEQVSQVTVNAYSTVFTQITGLPRDILENPTTELLWLREPIRYSSPGEQKNRKAEEPKFVTSMHEYQSSTSYNGRVQQAIAENPASIFESMLNWQNYVPSVSFQRCIPQNPVVEALQLRAELNLYKIRTCRNIAGVERELDLYAAPTDTFSGMPQIGAGGNLVLPGAFTFMPTPYRYAVIIERAKQLVSHSQQIESAFLSAIEKRDAEFYNLMKARQDIQTSRDGIRLQDLRIKGAEKEIQLSELQKDRAQFQADHYKGLLDDGLTTFEDLNIAFLIASAAQQVIAAIASGIAAGYAFGSFNTSGGFSAVASSASSGAAATSTIASIMATYASFERRAQEWDFQRSIAMHDVKIGSQQIKIAENRLRVVGQERYIANMQAEHAEQTAEFLANKFTNVELYDWMSDILEGVYGFFLQQASSTAQLAASQLAFERQEVPPPFIQDDYWEVKDDGGGTSITEETPVDRRGLTGSARLLQDIYQLDQHAFDTDERKNQIIKSISLAGLAPAEFQQFKGTGVLNFSTPMELFDRDFPGDYLRMIKRVRVSVIALIPPLDSIKASLTSTGSSRITIGGDIFQTVNINRGTEMVALSSPTNATGLFELQPQMSDKLNPFEGMGVDCQWQFMLPKAANRFDYNSIADVIVTIDYTSLSNFSYRQQVIHELNNSISAERPFSFRHQFADQWYDLNNPDRSPTPMIVKFETTKFDFPPNIDNLKIQQVVLYFVRKDGFESEIPVTYLKFTEKDSTGTVGGGATSTDGVISTRKKGNASSWTAMIGKSPYGDWELSLSSTALVDGRKIEDLFKEEDITDILFVITYSGRTPEWPA